MEHPLESYIDFMFNNDGERGPNQFFDFEDNINNELIELELEENPGLALDVLKAAFTDISTYLHSYSPYQLSNGLIYIFNQSFSNIGCCFQDKALDEQKQVQTLSALFALKTHIYNQHAEPILGHLSETVKDQSKRHLNSACYMFWDSATIPYNCRDAAVLACLDVMGKCARSPNIAVVEGAIHGLGHMIGGKFEAQIQSYIDAANYGTGQKADALRRYGEAAKRGVIQ